LEREIIKERISSGVQRAIANGVKLQRKSKLEWIAEAVRELRTMGWSLQALAKSVGVSNASVARALR
jgi:DNA invertase Pin-like site-specific DNA recombinase